MKKKNRLVLFAICYLVLSLALIQDAFAEAKPPSWVDTGGIKKYPIDFYITGVGSAEVIFGDTGAAQAEADSKAITQVAKQIRVKIRQLTESYEREFSVKKTGPVSQYDVWQKTAAFVELKVEGVRIEDRYYDKKNKQLYSLALLDRTAQGRMISEEIAGLESAARVLRGEAKKHLNNLEKVHRSVLAYGLALKKLLHALRRNQYLSIIAPPMMHRGISQSLSDLQSDFTNLLSRFTIQKIKGDRQEGIIGGSLTVPLVVKVFYDKQPVPSVKVMFGLVKGTANVDRQARTGRDGVASTTVGNLGPTGEKINKIRAYINFFPSDAKLQTELFSLIPPSYAQFTYMLPAVEDIRIAVLINEYNMGIRQTDKFLSNRIIQSLSKMKLNVIKQIPREYMLDDYDFAGGPSLRRKLRKLAAIADIAIVGEVKSTSMGGSGTLVFSRARAVVKIVDLKSSADLGNVDISIKGAGQSRDDSGLRAIKKVSQKASASTYKEIKRTLFGQ